LAELTPEPQAIELEIAIVDNKQDKSMSEVYKNKRIRSRAAYGLCADPFDANVEAKDCNNHGHDEQSQCDLRLSMSEMHMSQMLLKNIAIIAGIKNDENYDEKISKYVAYAEAMAIFGEREWNSIQRLMIRDRIQQQLSNGGGASAVGDDAKILEFIQTRYPQQCERFGTVQLSETLKIGFNARLMAHQSILQMIDGPFPINMDVKLIQTWMSAILMKISSYFVRYKSYHAVFCMRMLPKVDINDEECKYSDDENEACESVQAIQSKIQSAFNILDQSERELVHDTLWCFVLDFTMNTNVPSISLECRDLFDEDKVSKRHYDSELRSSALYHLKRCDYPVYKSNDSSAMALQISSHKFDSNQCVNWLTHSSGHVPLFNEDVVQLIPRLFAPTNNIFHQSQWKQVMEGFNVQKLEQMDRTFYALHQSFCL
jgi:hypothetical protein